MSTNVSITQQPVHSDNSDTSFLHDDDLLVTLLSEEPQPQQRSSAASSSQSPELIIAPSSGWQLIDWSELWHYRDMLLFLIWRDVKARYAQSVLGIGWAIIQPVFNMIVFTIVFGNLAQISSDGVPYAIFSYTALVPWTYFSGALTEASNSLVRSAHMINKVYFPRLILPLAAVCSKLVDFAIAMVSLFGIMLWFQAVPSIGVLLLPVLILIMMGTAAGLGALLTAMAVQYRDVAYGMTFGVALMMYASPVIYPTNLIPQQYHLIYALNPMVGVIEGFRSALLNTNPMPWHLLAVGTSSALVIVCIGFFYFRWRERIFADVA